MFAGKDVYWNWEKNYKVRKRTLRGTATPHDLLDWASSCKGSRTSYLLVDSEVNFGAIGYVLGKKMRREKGMMGFVHKPWKGRGGWECSVVLGGKSCSKVSDTSVSEGKGSVKQAIQSHTLGFL